MKALMKAIEKKFAEADDLSVKAVVYEAREILKADDGLDEFVMAMGGAFFTLKKGGKYDDSNMTDEEWEEWTESEGYVRFYNGILDDEHFQKEFFDNVDHLNELFKVCGYPTRFTATSKQIHHWGDTTKNPVVFKEMQEGENEDWNL